MVDAVLVFRLAGHGFALPAARVRECLPLPSLQGRPGLPAHVAGFLDLGGAALPVLDLAQLLGLRRADEGLALEADGLYRHLVLVDGVALLVDRATGLASGLPAPPDADADRGSMAASAGACWRMARRWRCSIPTGCCATTSVNGCAR